MPEAIQDLFNKYINNQCTPGEVETLMQYFHTDLQEELNQLIINELEQAEPQSGTGEYDELLDRVYGRIDIKLKQDKTIRNISLWPRIAAAASIILCLSVAGYFLFRNKPAIQQSAQTHNQVILPGGNKAILILGSGQRINLNNAKSGQLVKAAGIKITKDKNGQITYEVLPAGGENNLAVQYNTTQTPKGGQWHLVLADGTNVWLNAASSLHYPTAFTGKERMVELTGEGYFEVAKDKEHPFIVQTPKERIEVLGTHFNVNAYDDEDVQRTTLLEGKVKINTTSQPGQDLFLAPGEQATLKGNLINKKAIDPELAVAWQKGLFYYKNAPLPEVMRQIARWYDVDVSYAMDNPQGQTFSGSVSRYDKVEGLLNAIGLTGAVKFKIEGKKIIVTQ